MKRYFSADFHLGFDRLRLAEKWPFQTEDEHVQTLAAACSRAGSGDVIIHIGDLASDNPEHARAANDFVSKLPSDFINLRGNHDFSPVRSVCESMRTRLTKRFPSVSISHYPTYSPKCHGHFQPGDIHLCGHVHGSWRHCLDTDSSCLNINVGCMAWNFGIISEEEIVNYINRLLRYKAHDLFRCKKNEFGKNRFFQCAPEIDSDIFSRI